MEAPMARRRDLSPLEVRESFETTRLARQCLIDAYTRLVPIRREATKARHGGPPPAAAASRHGGGQGVSPRRPLRPATRARPPLPRRGLQRLEPAAPRAGAAA